MQRFKETCLNYYILCKPRVVLLMLLTAFVGMYLASAHFIWDKIFWGLIGIGLMASSAAVVNHLIDYQIDAIMARTKLRPIASGQVPIGSAILFSIILGVLGMFVLWHWVNIFTAILTFSTLIGYALIYTLFLKRTTSQNIVLGGLAGAMPPMLGWSAISGHFDPQSLLLVAIIFVWTPPHFWALAIFRHNEYAQVADIPMLPITHSIDYTKTQIVLYSLLLCVVAWLPTICGLSGYLYFVFSTVLGLVFLYYALRLKFSNNLRWGQKLFRYSIVYLMLLFIVLFLDRILRG